MASPASTICSTSLSNLGEGKCRPSRKLSEIGRGAARVRFSNSTMKMKRSQNYTSLVCVCSTLNANSNISRENNSQSIFDQVKKTADKIERLQVELNDAVVQQMYSVAASLRDEIRALEDRDPLIGCKKRFEEAVSNQHFEEAAKLRDELRRLLTVNIPAPNNPRVVQAVPFLLGDGSPSDMQESGEWLAFYSALKVFWRENGHCVVPDQPPSTLSTWVESQRHNLKEGSLSHKQRILLNSIGFDWESGAAEWMQQLIALKTHFRKYNSTTVARADDPELGMWLSEQRGAYKRNELSELRASMLEDIGVSL